MYIYYLFDSGYPLKYIEQENQTYMKIVPPKHTNSTILKQTRLMEFIRILMSSESEFGMFNSQMPIEVGVNLAETLKIMLAMIFAEYQQALKLGRAFFRITAYKLYDFAAFYMYLGIANISLFQQKGWKHVRLLIAARYYRKKVYQICKSTPDYALGKLALLKAEISSTSSRRHENTVVQYLIAISWANTKHHLFDGAFSNERYARYLLSRGDFDSAINYLRESCSLYRKWDASHKANLLQIELDELESKQCPEPCLRYLTSSLE
jgi:tetratricopeptide (TPR) repeat protein